MTRDDLNAYRRALQAVFQDPTSSLSPRMRVAEIVGEPLIASGVHTRRDVEARVEVVLRESVVMGRLGFPPPGRIQRMAPSPTPGVPA